LRGDAVAGGPGLWQFDHLELTFPVGTLTEEFLDKLGHFYGTVFGWTMGSFAAFEQTNHTINAGGASFVLAESTLPMVPVSDRFDFGPENSLYIPHLGVGCTTKEEFDRVFSECVRLQKDDPEVLITDFQNSEYEPGKSLTAFVLRYKLPWWLDVHLRAPIADTDVAWRYMALA
jgi:hypothetical protein